MIGSYRINRNKLLSESYRIVTPNVEGVRKLDDLTEYGVLDAMFEGEENLV